MTSESFHIIESIDFHVNKLAPENDTSESKNHVLLPIPYEDKYLATQAAVSTTATTTTINSINNVNKSITVNGTNSILIPSSTTTTATKNRANNENTNNNTVIDSNKLLTLHQQVHQQLQQITAQIMRIKTI